MNDRNKDGNLFFEFLRYNSVALSKNVRLSYHTSYIGRDIRFLSNVGNGSKVFRKVNTP